MTDANPIHDRTADEPTDVALAIALENATDPRVREHIRRAQQRRVILEDDRVDVDVDQEELEIATDGGPITCDRCGELVDPANHRIHMRPDGVTEDVCLACQTRVPHERLYTPSGEGGN